MNAAFEVMYYSTNRRTWRTISADVAASKVAFWKNSVLMDIPNAVRKVNVMARTETISYGDDTWLFVQHRGGDE